MNKALRSVLCLLFVLAACSPHPDLRPGSTRELASFTENSVSVDIDLEVDAGGQTWLAATFTPIDPLLQLYSKDTPSGGVDGLGRPTLIELVPGSQMQVMGDLTESVSALESEEFEGLYEYPAGAVTLRLPIRLPPGSGWVEESISVTYMACSGGSCYPPVLGKIIPIEIPGIEELTIP
jgi:hypothetical protein